VAISICQRGTKSPNAKAGGRWFKVYAADPDTECVAGLFGKCTAFNIVDPQPSASQVDQHVSESIEVAGPRIWRADLHEWAVKVDLSTDAAKAAALDHLRGITTKLPGCDCKKEYVAGLLNFPPDLSSNLALFDWTWAEHDRVNDRLGKQRITKNEARAMYSLPPMIESGSTPA
jgi:hypothetical protein